MGRRFVVGAIPEEAAQMFRSLNVEEGDVLIAPDGFPDAVDQGDPPTVELRRELHPNIAWFVAEYGTNHGFLGPLGGEAEEVARG